MWLTSGWQCCEKVFSPFWFSYMFFCHTCVVQMIRQMFLFDNNNPSKYKMQWDEMQREFQGFK